MVESLICQDAFSPPLSFLNAQQHHLFLDLVASRYDEKTEVQAHTSRPWKIAPVKVAYCATSIAQFFQIMPFFLKIRLLFTLWYEVGQTMRFTCGRSLSHPLDSGTINLWIKSLSSPLGLLANSCYCLLIKYIGMSTKVEIFALSHGLMNIIQNGVHRRALTSTVL